MSAELLAVLMVVAVCVLLAGYPVALTLGGVSLVFAVLGHLAGVPFGFGNRWGYQDEAHGRRVSESGCADRDGARLVAATNFGSGS